MSQGSVAQGGSWAAACTKCGRTNPGNCCGCNIGCLKCGQKGHFMREYPKNKQGGENTGNRSKSSSVATQKNIAPRGATSGTSGGANQFYVVTSIQEQENSPNVVTGTIKLFTLMFMLC